MNKSRVRLGPHLVAQTNPNPNPQGRKYFKIYGGILLILAIFWIANHDWGKSGREKTNLPHDQAILGAEAGSGLDSFYIYEVQASDSLFSLSQKFQVKWEDLVRLNDLKEPFLLTPEQKIKIPYSAATRQQQFYDNLKKKVYVVEAGDSFVGIAQKLNISVTDLLRANPTLSSPDFIRVGEVLHLP